MLSFSIDGTVTSLSQMPSMSEGGASGCTSLIGVVDFLKCNSRWFCPCIKSNMIVRLFLTVPLYIPVAAKTFSQFAAPFKLFIENRRIDNDTPKRKMPR